jgi:hypothetical protein
LTKNFTFHNNSISFPKNIKTIGAGAKKLLFQKSISDFGCKKWKVSRALLTVDSEVNDVRGWCCVVSHDSILCHALVVALVLPRHGHQLQAVTHPRTLTAKGQFSGQLANWRGPRGKPKPIAEMLMDDFQTADQ